MSICFLCLTTMSGRFENFTVRPSIVLLKRFPSMKTTHWSQTLLLPQDKRICLSQNQKHLSSQDVSLETWSTFLCQPVLREWLQMERTPSCCRFDVWIRLLLFQMWPQLRHRWVFDCLKLSHRLLSLSSYPILVSSNQQYLVKYVMDVNSTCIPNHEVGLAENTSLCYWYIYLPK